MSILPSHFEVIAHFEDGLEMASYGWRLLSDFHAGTLHLDLLPLSSLCEEYFLLDDLALETLELYGPLGTSQISRTARLLM